MIKVSKGGLKAEPADQAEIDGLIRSAKRKLLDAQTPTLGLESSFDLAYNAAHALAHAALRRQGYRSENRYLVFQALPHTVGFPAAKWRVLDLCHNKRNLAEYEGNFDVDPEAGRRIAACNARIGVCACGVGAHHPESKLNGVVALSGRCRRSHSAF